MIIHIIKKLYLTVEVPDSTPKDDIVTEAYAQIEKHDMNLVHDTAAKFLAKDLCAAELGTPRLENEYYTSDWTEL